MWWVLPLAAALELGTSLAIGLLFQPERLSFYGGLGLGLALATVMLLADAPPNHVERWREGADGEKATAEALRPLVRAGWVVFHDIDCGRGNIDHILIGPAGVFTLDSKRLRGLCTVKRGVLSVRWREDPDDGYIANQLGPRAQATAVQLTRTLQSGAAGFRHEVQPAIVLWADFEQTSIKSAGVAWIAGTHLAHVLRQRPVLLSRDEVQSLAHSIRNDEATRSLGSPPWTTRTQRGRR